MVALEAVVEDPDLAEADSRKLLDAIMYVQLAIDQILDHRPMGHENLVAASDALIEIERARRLGEP